MQNASTAENQKTHHSQEPVFCIHAEHSAENYQIVNLVKYSVIIILSVIAVLIIYGLISWLAKNVSMQFFIVRLLLMSFIPIIAMSLISLLVVKGMKAAFSRTKNVKVTRYCFYDEYFEIHKDGRVRRFQYDQVRAIYRILDHMVLVIRGISIQCLPPQVFTSDLQMINLETFIKIKLK